MEVEIRFWYDFVLDYLHKAGVDTSSIALGKCRPSMSSSLKRSMRHAPDMVDALQRTVRTAKVSATARKWETLSSATSVGGKARPSKAAQGHKGKVTIIAICAALALMLGMHVIRHRGRRIAGSGWTDEQPTQTKPLGEMVRLVQPPPPVTSNIIQDDYDVGDI